MSRLRLFAALAAALAIAAGAFGAHGTGGKAAEWLRTGGIYGLTHAVAVLVVMTRARGPAWMLLGGSLVFSGTLYALALGAPRILGAVTPLGGLMMIVGWLWFAVHSASSRNDETSASETDLST